METNICEIYEKIKEADMLLIGIGRELAAKAEPVEGDAELIPFFQSRYFSEIPQENALLQGYDTLRKLAGAKPYFVVTLNTDDLIWRSKLEDDLIVAPCGSMGKLQCREHIIDAAEIRERVLEDTRLEGGTLTGGHIERAVCPECGQPLQFHTIEREGYLEEGYLPQWNRYTKWLSCTLNRKLVILELGADFSFPQVIRWPFEKAAMYNQKAVLIRVGNNFPQIPQELAERGISIAQEPLAFLKKLQK